MKINIEFEISDDTSQYTQEQLQFIERHFYGNLAWLLESGGLGDLITPEIDWDDDNMAQGLFGETESEEGLDKNLDRHMDAAGLVISLLDGLYDKAIAEVRQRGGTIKSIYEKAEEEVSS